MLRTFTLAIALASLCITARAQQQITSANTFPTVGFTDSIYAGPGTNVGPSGNGVTWDFSGVTTTKVGYFSIVAPGTTPYTSTFPTATHAIMLQPTGAPAAAYEYYKIDATGWNILASGYSAASTSNNYNPNNKLRVPYPFAFGNTKVDTFQKLGSSLDGYTITYDGFGTLKVPGAIYNNVVRLKYQWIGGEIGYNWFTLSPLFFAATWSQDNGGTFTFLGKSLPTSVFNTALSAYTTIAYPLPAHESVSIITNAPFNNASCVIYDIAGHIVHTQAIAGPVTEIKRGAIAQGTYFYNVVAKGTVMAKGKIVFE